MSIPQISVIMGTYNPGDELKRAVDSIIAQSYKDWELIIYNDGSDSYHSAYIDEICTLDSRIIQIRGNVNSGLAHGLNECIKVASGQYVARMDDDDISEPDRFEMQKSFLDENRDYGWVGSTAMLFDEIGVWGSARRTLFPDKKDFLGSSPFIHPSVMFRREILVDAGGYRDETVTSRCEDYELFMRLYAEGFKGYNIQRPLIKYNQDRSKLKRSWRYSVNEAIVRYNGFKRMRILSPRTLIYVAKPVFVRLAAYTPRLSQKLRTLGKRGDTCGE